MSHDPCLFCGCVTLEEALPATLATIRADGTWRLPLVEMRLGEMTTDELASLYEWVTGSLRRPPLDRALGEPGGLHVVAHFLHCIREDLRDRVLDPASPVVDGWFVPMPHPRVIRADRGEVVVQVEPGRSETRVVDGLGVVRGER